MAFKVITNILSQQKSCKNKNTRNVADLKLYSSSRVIISIILLLQICLCGYLYPATPAGTVISNIISASYSNASGLIQSTSFATNTSLTVTNYSTLISGTNINSGLSGQTITFTHIVSNLANITNKLKLIATNLTGNALSFYLDTNSNGIRDPGEPSVTNITIPPKQSLSLLVQEKIPGTIQPSVYTDIISIRGSPVDLTNFTVKQTTDYLVILPTPNRILDVYATDKIHMATKLNGTENLGDLNTYIYMKLLYEPLSGTIDMYYDDKKPDAEGTKNKNDTKVRMQKKKQWWVGIIPADDPRVVNNNEIFFMFKAGGKKFYRTITPSTQAYSYIVKSYEYKEKCNMLNSILYIHDDSMPKPTVLCYLDETTYIKVEVYDLKGDKVRTLLDRECKAGPLKPITWNGKNDAGKDVGIGLYFISITCNKCEDRKEIFKVFVVKE